MMSPNRFVIPANAGIHVISGFRIESGMTSVLRLPVRMLYAFYELVKSPS